MSTSESIFTAAINAARAVVAGIPDQLASVKALGDGALLASQRELSELRRIVDARSSLVAGEVAYRSRRDLGYSGLAQREGFQNAEKLVQATTGSTRREASTLVTAGTLVLDSKMLRAVDPETGDVPEGFAVREPWLSAVGVAVADGWLTVDAARAIRSGLGEPDGAGTNGGIRGFDRAAGGESGVTIEALEGAVQELLAAARGDGADGDGDGADSEVDGDEDAASKRDDRGSTRPGLNADELYRLAREKRDELDEAGIAEREQLAYSQRSLRRSMRPNGLSRYTLDPDLEMSAWLDDVYDKLTSPRRGGPRFVDQGDRAWADDIATDTRTTEQYLHDAFLGLLRKGVDADRADARAESSRATGSRSAGSRSAARRTPRIVGSRLPAVRVLVTEESLRTRTGHGRIEGISTPVSIETVERQICVSGTIPIRFGNDGNVIDLGREARLFTTHQKIALAARDGGCMFPGCDRPASWTEAHHIRHWKRDGGNTDVADGILLCRHHHMLVHNNHWEIIRKHAKYWLIPPPDVDPKQQPRELVSKSAALRDLHRQRQTHEQIDSTAEELGNQPVRLHASA
ncbi:MAG: DUF222 domain-containing protein [Micrococcales bacterium]|nr:DUF222 domain-containing protein [Micrococcales bacterium]